MYKSICLFWVALLLAPAMGVAQQGTQEDNTKTYSIPFASQGNTIELAVANVTKAVNSAQKPASALSDVAVRATGVPDWMSLTPSTFRLGSLDAGSESTAIFSFDVASDAPVGQEVTLQFTAEDGQALSWEKSISLQVEPPASFELDQNYPNPFNPATTIRYRLPAEMTVTVNVYNILGQRVFTLADGIQQQTGQQTLRFDGSRLASGVYFFRITAQASGGQKITRLQKMTLIK